MKFACWNDKNRSVCEESIAVGLHHASSPIGKFELKGSNGRMQFRGKALARPCMQGQIRGDGDQVSNTKTIDRDFPSHCPVLPFATAVQPRVLCVISCNKVIGKGRFSIHAVPSRTKIPARLRFHACSNQTGVPNGGLDLSPSVHAYIIRKVAVAYQSNVGLERFENYV